MKCAAAEPDDGCAIYKEQCDVCPLFKTWLKRKKSAYDLKITVPLDNHAQEIQSISSLNTFDEFNLGLLNEQEIIKNNIKTSINQSFVNNLK